ncbi:MAG: hypothetical protein ACFFB5_15215 [Promethearchaeota archaeon]
MVDEQESKNNIREVEKDKSRAALRESMMDLAGHFSTASAILAGFYMATSAFVISVRAQGTDVFPFLDEPLLAEIAILGNLIMEILIKLHLSNLWPTHFEYMLLIFISLFLLSFISYVCFIRVGMIQMAMYTSNKVAEEKLLVWQQRGMVALLISLIFSFITLPWALLRFIFEQALVLALLLLATIIICLMIFVKGWSKVEPLFKKLE